MLVVKKSKKKLTLAYNYPLRNKLEDNPVVINLPWLEYACLWEGWVVD